MKLQFTMKVANTLEKRDASFVKAKDYNLICSLSYNFVAEEKGLEQKL
jgi:hypothetical protein